MICTVSFPVTYDKTAGLPNTLGEILIWLGIITPFAAAEEISAAIGIGTIMIGAETMFVWIVFADAIRAQIIASADANASVSSAITSVVTSTATTDFNMDLFRLF
jgi:hypothetical protein